MKLIDRFLDCQLPKIQDFFIYASLKKVLQRTDWLKPASEEIKMNSVHDLKLKFVQKFPFVEYDSDLSLVAAQLNKIDLNYYLNNENLITGNPNENFDSRKTKIKDEIFKGLYD